MNINSLHTHRRSPTRVREVCLTLAVLSGSAGSYSHAAGPADASANVSDATALEEITVTARKRDEKLQDVPVAITAITSAAIDRLNIVDISGLTKITPNVTIESVSNSASKATVFIRGAGERADEPLHDAANAISMDGVYLVGANGAMFDTFDLQQVEILRGPQGTLEGRNAVGGAVNLTSRRPTFENHAEVEVGAGNYQSLEGKVMIEGGLVPDIAAAKFAFVVRNREGYIRNTTLPDSPLGSVESYFGRGGILLTPSAGIDIYLTVDYLVTRPGQIVHSADDTRSYPSTNHAPADTQLESANCRVFGKCTPDPNWTTTASFVKKDLGKSGGVSSNINVDLGGAKLTSVTGFRRAETRANNDLDASISNEFFVTDFREDSDLISQELRLASQPGGGLDFRSKLDWVGGLYFLRSHFDSPLPVFLNGLAVGIPQSACQATPGKSVWRCVSRLLPKSFFIPQANTWQPRRVRARDLALYG